MSQRCLRQDAGDARCSVWGPPSRYRDLKLKANVAGSAEDVEVISVESSLQGGFIAVFVCFPSVLYTF